MLGSVLAAGQQPEPSAPAPSSAPDKIPASIRRVGGGVSPPVVLTAPEPEFSDEARKKHISGSVLVYLQISEEGQVEKVHVIRGVGYGLDEKAMEAIQQYVFKPAMENGHPVRVEINVEVNFQLIRKRHLWN